MKFIIYELVFLLKRLGILLHKYMHYIKMRSEQTVWQYKIADSHS